MKKPKRIPFIFFMGAIVFLSACHKADVYDIRGTWKMAEYFGGAEFLGSITFSGDMTNGTWADQNKITGTYTDNGFEVKFSFDATIERTGRVHGSFSGTFSGENYMSGKGEYIYYDQDNSMASCYWVCGR